MTAIGGFVATPAWADVWTYVDVQGTTHFSTVKVDDSYELFLRGSDSFSVGNTFTRGALDLIVEPLTAPESPRTAALPTPASLRLMTYFDISPNYKAVKHLLREAAATHGIDYELLQALIATESGFDAQAVSPKGAVGLMQLIPPTAARYGVKADKNIPIEKKLTDPRTNIRAGSSYLRDLIKLFPGQLELALAAYNAGEGAVQRAGNKIPNYPETKNYVKNVMQLYQQLLPSQGVPRATAQAVRGRVRMELAGPGAGRGVSVASGVPPVNSGADPFIERD
jgi:soluble lytic murein transglycosylase-like protein